MDAALAILTGLAALLGPSVAFYLGIKQARRQEREAADERLVIERRLRVDEEAADLQELKALLDGYKQLAEALKAEREQLHKIVSDLREENHQLGLEVIELRRENRELHEAIKDLRQRIDGMEN